MGKARSNTSLGVRGSQSQAGMWKCKPMPMPGHTAQVGFLLPLELMQVFRCFPGWLVLESRRFVFCWQPTLACSLRYNLKLIMLPSHLCGQPGSKGRSSGSSEIYFKRQHFPLNSSISLPFPPDAVAFYFAYIISRTSKV